MDMLNVYFLSHGCVYIFTARRHTNVQSAYIHACMHACTQHTNLHTRTHTQHHHIITSYPHTYIHVYTYVCVDSIRSPSGCLPGYAVALDMTARDLQQAAKEKGLPWTISKGYDTFTAVGETVREGGPGWGQPPYLLDAFGEAI